MRTYIEVYPHLKVVIGDIDIANHSSRFSYSGMRAEAALVCQNETTPQMPLLRLKNETVFFVINSLKFPPHKGYSQI